MLEELKEFEDLIESKVKEGKKLRAVELGLDGRCGWIWLFEDCVATKAGESRIEYYGGFEYIDRYYVTTLGRYTFYAAEADRVQECIDFYNEHHDVV